MDNETQVDLLISELKIKTNSVINDLSSITYEELESFVEIREQIVNKLMDLTGATPTTAQKIKVQEILRSDPAIISCMNDLRLEARDWIRQRNQAKVQRNAYEGYSVRESILMDRKK